MGRGTRFRMSAENKTERRIAKLYQAVTWLGREDSNLRMAESKSEGFPSKINAHSEKLRKSTS
jgi:hypothetical protein